LGGSLKDGGFGDGNTNNSSFIIHNSVGGALHTIFLIIPTEAMPGIAKWINLPNDWNNHPPVTYAHPPKPLKYVKKSQKISIIPYFPR